MSKIEGYAVTVAELRKSGACGYPEETLMVPYSLALHSLKIREEANRIVREENNKWAKELELAKNEIEMLRKKHL